MVMRKINKISEAKMKTKTITTDNFKTYECNIKLIADNPKLKLFKEIKIVYNCVRKHHCFLSSVG